MKNSILAGFAFLLLASLGAAQDVTYNFDADANFEKYQTYKWVDIGSSEQIDELTAKQIVSALEGALAKRGLKKVDSGNADLNIAYQVALRGERELSAYSTGGYGAGWRYGGGMGTTRVTSNTIVVGTLALDMYESGKNQLVWRGTATKTVDQNAKPDKRQKNLQKGAEKLLKNYPPKKK